VREEENRIVRVGQVYEFHNGNQWRIIRAASIEEIEEAGHPSFLDTTDFIRAELIKVGTDCRFPTGHVAATFYSDDRYALQEDSDGDILWEGAVI